MIYKKPKVIILSGISIDGKMTIKKGVSSKVFDKLLEKEAFEPLMKLRATCDGVMVGSKTICVDNPSLLSIENKRLLRIIPTTHLKIPLNSKIFQIKPENTLIATVRAVSRDKIQKIIKIGSRVIFCGKKRLNLRLLFDKLYKLGLRRILVEGGGTLNYLLLRNSLVDEINVLFLPFVVGNKDAPSLFEGSGFPQELLKLKLKYIKLIKDKYILVSYKVK
jgi:5-amino-6-(5-phosphoribosylamino)uracil reductase